VFWRGLLVRELSEKAKVTANEIKNKIGKNITPIPPSVGEEREG
jgi:hypothetical protein